MKQGKIQDVEPGKPALCELPTFMETWFDWKKMTHCRIAA